MVLHCNEAASLVRLWTETLQLDHLCQSYISLSRRSSPDKGFLHLWTCRPFSLSLSLSRLVIFALAHNSCRTRADLHRKRFTRWKGRTLFRARKTSWKRVLRALNGRLFRGGSWQELIAARLPLMAIDGRLVIVRFVGRPHIACSRLRSATFMTGHGGNKTLYRRITESRIDLEIALWNAN